MCFFYILHKNITKVSIKCAFRIFFVKKHQIATRIGFGKHTHFDFFFFFLSKFPCYNNFYYVKKHAQLEANYCEKKTFKRMQAAPTIPRIYIQQTNF